jgi:hypothetical protein
MFLFIVTVMSGRVLSCGGMNMSSGSGGSVASMRAAKESMSRLIHSSCTAVSGNSGFSAASVAAG